jgi:hypothetical protein
MKYLILALLLCGCSTTNTYNCTAVIDMGYGFNITTSQFIHAKTVNQAFILMRYEFENAKISCEEFE